MNPSDENPAAPASETLHWGPDGGERDLTGKTLGDFHVQRLLGRGGMGEVYLALQLSLNRPVALKVLRPDLIKRPIYLSRFEAEATAVAKLNHPNIVHVYTLGEVDGVRFIAMEYVQGTNLREYIRKKGSLEFPLALSIIRQTGLAVGAAGERGLVHRDIKPENILLTRKGEVKVADFGLCRNLDAEAASLTQTGITMGTPLYMSPEQAQGRALDHRSDLYSLGVTYYHMIAGNPPFTADSAVAIALKHVKNVPTSLTVHRPDVPPALDRLVLKLMAKAPDDRYQSAVEMLRDLAKVREALSAPAYTQTLADVPGPLAAGGDPEKNKEKAKAQAQATPAESGGGPRSSRSAPAVEPAPVGSAPAPRRAFSPAAGGALVAVGLALGCAAGWVSRPTDLLAEGSPAPSGAPGLWLEPGWRVVEKKGTAEQQYRDAQLRAPADGLEAAWLAVPGHFPNSRDWASLSYTQLARLLLRRGDADRLEALADDLGRWELGQTRESDLVALARSGVKALRGDLDGVLDDFDGAVKPTRMTDTALIDLALEVTQQAERIAGRPGKVTNPALVRQRLRDVQRELLPRLLLTELRGPGPGRPPRLGRPGGGPTGAEGKPFDRP